MRSGRRTRRGWRRHVCIALLATASLAAATPARAEPPDRSGEVPFAPVLQTVLAGDLVMAGNSNLLTTAAWRPAAMSSADVDGDTTLLCVGRRYVPAACADNSSSATLDIPAGARVVHARLYVDTTLSSAVSPIRVRLDGPADGFEYTELSTTTPGIPKLAEGSGGGSHSGPVLRQAVWDVTGFVAAAGSGSYTVGDIMHERAGAWLPYASWAIVAAYELDPDSGVDLTQLPPEQQQRFASRAVSWHDGFVVRSEGSIDVPVTGFQVTPGVPVFAKSLHIVAHAQHHGVDNLLFEGGPIGNNATPGNAPAPPGVTIGADPACNSTTDILNDSICVLGTPVSTKAPGATEYRAVADGTTPTSGSAVDMDVIRVPDRYFRAGASAATLRLRMVGDDPVATGMLAMSVDLPPAPAVAAPAPAETPTRPSP